MEHSAAGPKSRERDAYRDHPASSRPACPLLKNLPHLLSAVRPSNAPAAVAKSSVSKSEITGYARCPYAFWLVDSGQVAQEDAFSAFTISLMEAGIAFEDRVVAEMAVPWELSEGGFPELFAQDGLTLFGLPKFENPSLSIRGIPDAIETAGGALYPVEVKSHRKAKALDRLELAFYWDLLAPWRTRAAEPEGVLVLPDGEGFRTVRVSLTQADFDQARRLVAAVRTARAEGVEPRVCDCHVCSGHRKEALASALRRRDLILISGIESALANGLSAIGCQSYDQLGALDPAWVAARLKERDLYTTRAGVERWQLHARSYAEERPVFLPGHSLLPDLCRHVSLDLEWDRSGQIFLVGAALVEDGEVAYTGWWADTLEEERAALVALSSFLAECPGLPVLTWAGQTADLPHIYDRLAFHGAEGAVAGLAERHFDMLVWARSCFRLPVPSLRLKAVGQALGFTKVSEVTSGGDALSLFWQYQATADLALRDQLIAYNHDDVASLSFVAGEMARLERLADVAVAA